MEIRFDNASSQIKMPAALGGPRRAFLPTSQKSRTI
jgi:hypothetical protein